MSRIPAELTEAYEIVKRIHQGSSGSLYQVRHRLLGDLRVAKVLQPRLDNPALRDAFVARAQAVSRLSHPNIARLYDFSIDNQGLAHVVLEYVAGISLEELVSSGTPPPLGLGLAIARQVLRAVGHLHRHQVVHRHLSADNLMLARHVEGGPEVKLVEPGLVPQLDDATAPPRSWPLDWLRYAAPEMLSEGLLVPQSDLYSLGVVFYQLFTGQHPIAGSSVEQLITGHLSGSPLEFARSDPQRRVPNELRRLVLAALAKDAAARPRDAAGMLRSVEFLGAAHPCAAEDLEIGLRRPTPPAEQTTVATPRPARVQWVDAPTVVVARPAVAVGRPEDSLPSAAPTLASPSPSARERQCQQRRQSFAQLCRQANELRAQGQLEDALGKARAALDISLSNPEGRRLAVEIEHQLAERAARQSSNSTLAEGDQRTAVGQRREVSAEELEQMTAEIRRLLANRWPERAMATLQEALMRCGERPELVELRHQVAEQLLDRDAFGE